MEHPRAPLVPSFESFFYAPCRSTRSPQTLRQFLRKSNVLCAASSLCQQEKPCNGRTTSRTNCQLRNEPWVILILTYWHQRLSEMDLVRKLLEMTFPIGTQKDLYPKIWRWPTAIHDASYRRSKIPGGGTPHTQDIKRLSQELNDYNSHSVRTQAPPPWKCGRDPLTFL